MSILDLMIFHLAGEREESRKHHSFLSRCGYLVFHDCGCAVDRYNSVRSKDPKSTETKVARDNMLIAKKSAKNYKDEVDKAKLAIDDLDAVIANLGILRTEHSAQNN